MAEIWRLDDMTVKAIKGPNPGKTVTRLNDGGGLFLRVTRHKSKQGVERVSKSWEFFFTLNSDTSCSGLGPYAPHEKAPGLTLTAARDEAHELRKLVKAGINPVVEKRRLEAERKAAATEAKRLQEIEESRAWKFSVAVETYLTKKDAELESARHRQIWRSSLYRYAIPILGEMNVAEITMQDVLRVLNQEVEGEGGATLWECRTETASRLRNRIEAVLSAATVAGYRAGENPARWAGNLKEILPSPMKLTKGKKDKQPALTLADMPTWYSSLAKQEGMGAKALMLAVLCASRSAEVRGMVWSEVHDLNGGNPTWVIPAQRTKTDEEYTVPLSAAAVVVLKALPRIPGNDLVFPAPRGGVMSDMTISAVMRRMHKAKVKEDGRGYIDPKSNRPAVPHGTCRATFRTWVQDETEYEFQMAEIALGHKVGNAVSQAYARGNMLSKRRGMMDHWAAFCLGQEPAENVVPLRGVSA